MSRRRGPLAATISKDRADLQGVRRTIPKHGELRGDKQRINSRQKGAAGEREFAHFLSLHNLNAYRGQQFRGGGDSPDVICQDLTDVHWEVKRTEKGNLYIWMKQAIRDGGSKLPIVAHRRNKEDWVAVIRMVDLIPLLIAREGAYL